MLIEWDTLEIRLDGARLNDLTRSLIPPPIDQVRLSFLNGLLRVDGIVRKFVNVPFTIEITELRASGREVRIPVRSATAFGAIPIPRLLFTLMQGQLPRDLVGFEEPATFVVRLDRFLPKFVSAEIQTIWIIDGGLAVTLGRGGADPPPEFLGGKS